MLRGDETLLIAEEGEEMVLCGIRGSVDKVTTYLNGCVSWRQLAPQYRTRAHLHL